ncbi:MAG: hypothetical protein EPO21_07960 [Chloroflexota bacterium]|nr:MAG: hypothetical protein EPO21_07960 [Chloroflexota bacterium]
MWTADYFSTLGKTLSQYAVEKMGRRIHLFYGYAYMGKSYEWFTQMYEVGGLGPAGETFNGGMGGRGAVDLEKSADWHHEHECFMSYTIEDRIMEFGSPTELEEAVKQHCLSHKHMPRFAPGYKPPYWTPFENLDIAIAAHKKYGRYD